MQLPVTGQNFTIMNMRIVTCWEIIDYFPFCEQTASCAGPGLGAVQVIRLAPWFGASSEILTN